MAVNLHFYARDENGTFSHTNEAGSFHDTLDEYEMDLFNLIVLGVFGSVVNIGGIFLTLFILITLSRMRPKSACVILLVGIAYSDLVILFLGQILVFMPRAFGFMESMASFVGFVEMDYRFLYPVKDCALIVNGWLLMALAFERYIFIAHPELKSRFLSRRRVVLTCAVIVLCATLFDIPKFFEYHTITHHDVSPHDRQLRIEASQLHDNKVFMWLYMFALDLLLRVFVPLIFMVVFVVLIVRGLKSFKASHQSCSMKEKAKAEMTVRVILIVLALMISFIVIQIPYLATNSAMKMFIYLGMSKNFRVEMKMLFSCCTKSLDDDDVDDDDNDDVNSMEVKVTKKAANQKPLSIIEE